MASSGPQIFVRVYSLKGLPADVLKRYPRGRVFVSSEVDNVKTQTGLVAYGGAVKANEVG